ncbi:hypothetical protein EXN22_13160 [Pseudomonas tructae]|uniref:Uncharacterized protein n=1 Tax=Pseudomonas tructae TaxID=2518644 RepID=A0A411MIB4_9PSED|nr:hypothetical protein EXN22_13160 [Pseudomonas tructae]
MHHCADHQPDTGDLKENARLAEALASAINDAMSPEPACGESTTTIDPQLLREAIALFGTKRFHSGTALLSPMTCTEHRRPPPGSVAEIAIRDRASCWGYQRAILRVYFRFLEPEIPPQSPVQMFFGDPDSL